MSAVTQKERALQEEILRLKEEKHAMILAHNYQLGPVQDIADAVGDSLNLARQAAASDADIIVFCGVEFMAETASILCPDKKVLLPDREAGCSLAASVTAQDVLRWRREHPEGVVVSYVNTSAEVKAVSDYCCTSANARQVIEAIPADKEILFVPDMFLGTYLERVTGRSLHVWMGECHVHAQIRPETVEQRRREHPDAEFLVHPECGCVSSCLVQRPGDTLPPPRFLSTEGMVRHVGKSPYRRFLVATEEGILHRMRQRYPDREFMPVQEGLVCSYMKKITLEKVRRSLEEEVEEIRVPEEVRVPARRAIERMLAMG